MTHQRWKREEDEEEGLERRQGLKLTAAKWLPLMDKSMVTCQTGLGFGHFEVHTGSSYDWLPVMFSAKLWHLIVRFSFGFNTLIHICETLFRVDPWQERQFISDAAKRGRIPVGQRRGTQKQSSGPGRSDPSTCGAPLCGGLSAGQGLCGAAARGKSRQRQSDRHEENLNSTCGRHPP